MQRLTKEHRNKFTKIKNNILLWNRLIYIADKYEKKYLNTENNLSDIMFYLGKTGHRICLGPKLRIEPTGKFKGKPWKSFWKDVYNIYGKEMVNHIKKCLSLLKKYNKKT